MVDMTPREAARTFGTPVVVNTRQVESALKRFSPELAKATRREMAQISREVRDRIRADWVRGPAKDGHSFRAVTSGTRGLNPTVRLNREYRPYVGWLAFGGRRPRDTVTRPRPPSGRWFYPEIARARPEAVRRVKQVLDASIRKAGLS